MARHAAHLGARPAAVSLDDGIAAALDARVARSPHAAAATRWVDDAMRCDDWTQLRSRVQNLATALEESGCGAGDPVGLFLKTSYTWMLVDYAAQTLGAVSVVFHPGWSESEIKQALAIVCPALIVCGVDEAALLQPILARLGRDTIVWVHAGESDDDAVWQRTKGERDAPVACARRSTDAIATIVFTSGTGGGVKAVVLSQRALIATASQAYARLGFDGGGVATLHWLPLSHMFGRLGLYLDLLAGGHGHFGRGPEHLADDLRAAAPAVLFAVPIALTRLRHRISAALVEQTPTARRIARLAFTIGGIVAGTSPALRVSLQYVLRALVFRRLHRAMGGNLRVIVVGGAPVDATDTHFFETLGIAVREGYGLIESSGVVALQGLRHPFRGAGKMLPGVEAMIGDDDELLLRGAIMLDRYLNGDAYDAGGWFHTGDRCKIDRDGALSVIGRIKDVVIPTTGENVDPAKLEALILRDPSIADVCIVGNGRPCLIALVVLSETPSAAPSAAIDARRHIDAVNARSAAFEQVRDVIVTDAFSVAAGELTITAKKRRDVIQTRRATEIDQCFAALRTRHVPTSIQPMGRPMSLSAARHSGRPSATDLVVDIAALSHSYATNETETQVLASVDLQIRPREFVAILGSSGSGKSTLLNLIGGLDHPQSGRMTVCGTDLMAIGAPALERFRQSQVAFVFQFFNLLASLTAVENVELALEAMTPRPSDIRARAMARLDDVGLGGKAHRFPAQLSGGEQQRVAIARALVRDVPLILADEPTGNLDEATAAQVMALFETVQAASGAALLLITHDPAIAARADRVVHLVNGRFAAPTTLNAVVA